MTPQLIDKGKIYFYILLLLVLLSMRNKNSINYMSNLFKVQKIKINSDLDENSNKEIINSLNKFYNNNILLINEKDIKETLDSFNLISEYNVKKEYPSSISLNLKKTNLLASFIENNQLIYLGENGKKIKTKLYENNLPVIFGKFNIEEFLNLRQKLILNNFEINNFNKFYFFKSKRWDLLYKNKVTIKLPINDIDISIEQLKKLIKDPNLIKVKTIDLRIKDKIIIS